MITRINKDNASDYRNLFDKANTVLQLEGEDEIHSLEDYFSYIQNLAAEDEKYVILPLDEDAFEIDANKRLINVPASFKINGISVQGDQIAEVIYFEIDRFFDATDLNEMDIFIQWQASNGDQGISKAWIKDIESKYGKLIFGWPLSKEITVKSGAVKFAVRFVKFDETDPSKVLYSFSTLTAEAPIKSALDFDISSGAIKPLDYSDFIVSRLVNSSASIPGAGVSELPEILKSLDESIDLDENKEAALYIQARSTDAGKILCSWRYYKLSYDEETKAYVLSDIPTTVSNGEVIYLKTNDKEADKNKEYYYSTIENNIEVKRLAGEDEWERFLLYPENDLYTLYERYYKFIAKDIGAYTATVSNKHGKAAEAILPEEGKTFEEYGLICNVPAPATPTISKIYKDDINGEIITKYIIQEPGVEAPVLSDGSIPTENVILFAEAEASDEGITNAEGEPVTSLVYQWFRDGVALEGETEKSYVVSGAIAEGIYTLKATNTRNFNSLSVISEGCRVSYPPVNPQLLTPTDHRYRIDEEIDASMFIIHNDVIRTDKDENGIEIFKYKWYELDGNGEPILIPEVEEAKYLPGAGGSYQVEIFSEYNGVTLNVGTMSSELMVSSK